MKLWCGIYTFPATSAECSIIWAAMGKDKSILSRLSTLPKTRNMLSEAKVLQVLIQKKKKSGKKQIDINNKWRLYCTSMPHEIQLLPSFQILQDTSTSNYWKHNASPKIINTAVVPPSCTNLPQGKGFWRTDLLILLLFV